MQLLIYDPVSLFLKGVRNYGKVAARQVRHIEVSCGTIVKVIVLVSAASRVLPSMRYYCG